MHTQKKNQSDFKTEAQRTQGIDSLTSIFFSTELFTFYLVGEITQFIESIPLVRCASGNVFIPLIFLFDDLDLDHVHCFDHIIIIIKVSLTMIIWSR